MLDMLGLPYTGAAAARACRLLRQGPRPRRRHHARRARAAGDLRPSRRPGRDAALGVFPAILKPNYGDSSEGITKDAVVTNEKALLDYLDKLRAQFPRRPVLVQEFLTGTEYSVGLIGNPDQGLRALPLLEVDYSRLDDTPAEDPRLRIEVGARQPLLDADQVPRGAAGRAPAGRS